MPERINIALWRKVFGGSPLLSDKRKDGLFILIRCKDEPILSYGEYQRLPSTLKKNHGSVIP